MHDNAQEIIHHCPKPNIVKQQQTRWEAACQSCQLMSLIPQKSYLAIEHCVPSFLGRKPSFHTRLYLMMTSTRQRHPLCKAMPDK